jgi:carboxymethylenebutenolidase
MAYATATPDDVQTRSAGGRRSVESSEMERIWGEHLTAEFGTKDVGATLATMVDEPYITNMAVGTGGCGKEEVRSFYEEFIASWPEDLHMEPLNRVVGVDHIVDEVRVTFTHGRRMEWLLPGVPPTGRRIQMDVAIVVPFESGRIAGERIYWDQATVLHQAGLLPARAGAWSKAGHVDREGGAG